jgi:hypothetical protein
MGNLGCGTMANASECQFDSATVLDFCGYSPVADQASQGNAPTVSESLPWIPTMNPSHESPAWRNGWGDLANGTVRPQTLNFEPRNAEPSYAEPSYAEPSYAEPSYAEPTYAERRKSEHQTPDPHRLPW